MAACSSDIPFDEPFRDDMGEILATALNFRDTPGTYTFRLRLPSGAAAVIDGSCPWVRVAQTGEDGLSSITVEVDANTAQEPRQATLLISHGLRIHPVSIRQEAQSRNHTRRTVLVYMAAENSLSGYADKDIAEMMQAGGQIPSDCNLLIYKDDAGIPVLSLLEPQPDGRGVLRTLRTFPEERDSATGETLEEMLSFTRDNFPSDGYGLVMWSHGEGWMPGTTRWCGVDNNSDGLSNSGSFLGISRMASAIGSSVGSLDFLMFDACMMGTLEVAWAMRDVTGVMIASPCEIPGPGAPYHRIMHSLFSPDMRDCGVAGEYVSYYRDKYAQQTSGVRYGALMATLDPSAAADVAGAFEPVISRHFRKGSAYCPGNPLRYATGSLERGLERDNVYLDADQIIRGCADSEEYAAWHAAFSRMRIGFEGTSWWYSAVNGMNRVDPDSIGGVACTFLFGEDSGKLAGYLRSSGWFDAAGWGKSGW